MSAVATGAANEIVRGINGTVSIGTNRWDLKKLVNLDIGSPVYSDSTPIGIIHHLGNEHNSFTIEIYVSQPDLATLLALRNKSASGNPTSNAIRIVTTDTNNNSSTISGTGFVYNISYQDNENEEKVYCILNGKFTSNITVTAS